MTGENVNGASNGAASMETYKPKNILITGGAGFIASHVAIRLTKNYSDYTVRFKI
jgi:nucleoside-diphosphate-sugar epimerase